MIKVAVKYAGTALKYVPWEMRTKEVVVLAIKSDPNAIAYVPKALLTQRINAKQRSLRS